MDEMFMLILNMLSIVGAGLGAIIVAVWVILRNQDAQIKMDDDTRLVARLVTAAAAFAIFPAKYASDVYREFTGESVFWKIVHWLADKTISEYVANQYCVATLLAQLALAYSLAMAWKKRAI